MLPQASLGRSDTRVRINFWIEKVARVKGIVALEKVGGSVNIVCSRFDSQVDDCAGLPTIFCWRVLLGVELLNRVDGKNRARRPLHSFGIYDCCSVIRIVVVRAVKYEVVVLGPVAVGAN